MRGYRGEKLLLSRGLPHHPPKCSPKSIQKLGEGIYPKWSKPRNLIVFNKVIDGRFEIFTMKPDGTNVTCITCDKKELPDGHRGQPYWHLTGEYIVFTVENSNYTRSRWKMVEVPGLGRNHDVWIMKSTGEKFWQITNTPENGGIIRPSFSPDGTKIYWNEEYSLEVHPDRGAYWSLEKSPVGEKWGLWRFKIADFFIDQKTGMPVISNIRTVDINKLYPGKVVLEGQGIQPDNNHLIFSAADINETEGYIEWGIPPKKIYGKEHWGELYTTDLSGRNLVRLTHALYQHDENAEYSPDERKIVWSRAKGAPGKQTELYLMDANGENQVRLTYFTQSDYPEYIPQASGSNGEIDWSPDGTQIIFGYGIRGQLTFPYLKADMFLLTFEGPCGKL